jgi:hypothetical protein
MKRLDPVLILLFVCMIFFTGVLFSAEIWFNNDSQIFQVVAGILTGIVGAFLGRIKPEKGDPTVVQSGPDASINVPPLTNALPSEKKP